ncbi:MAG TPA: hypothetical protein VMX75_00215 [Spirochaetia bacterium]|nr:hypothetical protein [Spirochaetia bacterium]
MERTRGGFATAAVPAAWPWAPEIRMTRVEAKASWLAEIGRLGRDQGRYYAAGFKC